VVFLIVSLSEGTSPSGLLVFARVLEETVDAGHSYEEVLERFGGRFGREAKALVRRLMATRGR